MSSFTPSAAQRDALYHKGAVYLVSIEVERETESRALPVLIDGANDAVYILFQNLYVSTSARTQAGSVWLWGNTHNRRMWRDTYLEVRELQLPLSDVQLHVHKHADDILLHFGIWGHYLCAFVCLESIIANN